MQKWHGDMNTLDIIILLVLALGLLAGLRSGFIKQVLGIAGLIVAIILAIQFMDPVGSGVGAMLGVQSATTPLIGFGVIFLAVQVVVQLLARVLRKAARAMFLGPVDRILGGVIGGLKACLVLSMIFVALASVGLPAESWRSDSQFYDGISGVLPSAWEYVADVFPQVAQLSEKFGDQAADILGR